MKAMKLVVPAFVSVIGLATVVAGGCMGSSTSSSSSSSSSSTGGPADCSTRPANHAADSSSTTTKASVDMVAVALTSGTGVGGKYCGNADGHAYWWKLAGAHAANSAFHLVVTWDRAAMADDVDFTMVSFDTPGPGFTTLTNTTGNCAATSGTTEDCVKTSTPAITDVYVKTTTSTTTTNEAFNLTVTKM